MNAISNNKYNRTIYACFVGSIAQAVVNNLPPLLFLTFQTSYGISMGKITLLITFNFFIQLCVDALSVFFVDRIGYRPLMVSSHLFSAFGLILMSWLPDILPDPYVGLFLSMALYAVGSGLAEVLISPVMEACPTENKEKAMSLLHSFYCWGYMTVVLLSTLYFSVFGISSWRILTRIWAIIPFLNAIAFTRVPIAALLTADEKSMPLSELIRNRLFWLLLFGMICAGASEQGVSQWASALAEKGLGISKALGDLMGPMFFAMCMGIARVLYGIKGDTIPLRKYMMISAVLCVFSYLLIALTPWPFLGLLGCGICGFSVGIFWPGTCSIAAASLRRGGSALFALLALAGDIGCSSGPTVIGFISSAFNDNLQIGAMAGLLFPLGMVVFILLQRKKTRTAPV